MTWQTVPPTHLGHWRDMAPGETPQRILLNHDPADGTSLRITVQPIGWPGLHGRPGEFESHTCDEEVYMLRGTMNFQDRYTLVAGDYASHPPHWVHPSGQVASTTEPTVFLIRHSGPVDFFYDPIPEPWTGEFFTDRPFEGPRAPGCTQLAVEGATWNDSDDGRFLLVLRHDPASGLTTWLEAFPPGWTGGAAEEPTPGHDERFVIEGSLTCSWQGAPVTLSAGSYCSDVATFHPLGEGASSPEGALVLRWSRLPEAVVLPAPVLAASES